MNDNVLEVPNDQVLAFREPQIYDFYPQADITALDIAMTMRVLQVAIAGHLWEKIPEELQRHWKKRD